MHEQRQSAPEGRGGRSCYGIKGKRRAPGLDERDEMAGVLAAAAVPAGAAIALCFAGGRGALPLMPRVRGDCRACIMTGRLALCRLGVRSGLPRLTRMRTREQTTTETQEKQQGDEGFSHSRMPTA